MKIELMIYIYIAICVCMIAFNTVYIFILRKRERSLVSNSERFSKQILGQISNITDGNGVDEKHKKRLKRVLQRTAYITAFDKALEKIHNDYPNDCEKYLTEIYSVFKYLTEKYISKDTIKIAYFPYILQKYGILRHDSNGELCDILFGLLRSVNVYCRENTLKALYTTENAQYVAKALSIIDKNLSFHHPKLICDGLLNFKGDTNPLRDALISSFDTYSVEMQLNIMNYFRFGSIRCDDFMLCILCNEKQDNELRFSAMRYFEKFPTNAAKETLMKFATNYGERTWEYCSIACSALKSYPGDDTFRILVKNLSNSNWYIRLNCAVSLEKLGYTYHDLINVFDGNDRYAREIMRYRLDRRKAEEKAVMV